MCRRSLQGQTYIHVPMVTSFPREKCGITEQRSCGIDTDLGLGLISRV